MRTTFKFWLFNKAKQAMYIDDAGNIAEADGNMQKPDGQPAHLTFSPDGWENTSVKVVRNIKYWGLFRDMITPLKFVGDGFKILKKQVWAAAGGVETIAHLGISKFANTILPYVYTKWHLSELNFSKYVEEETQASIEALEGGPSKYLKANENTVYEIPIDTDPDHINVKFRGITLFQNGSYILGGEVSNVTLGDRHTAPVIFLQSEGDTGGTNYASQFIEEVSNVATYLASSVNYFLSNNTGETRTYRLTGNIIFQTKKNDVTGSVYRVDLFKSTGIGSQDEIASFVPMIVDEITTIPVDKTFSLNDGEKMFLLDNFHGLFVPGSTEIKIEYLETSSLRISFESNFKNTYVKGHRPLKVAKYLFEQMSGGLYTVSSIFLQNLTDCFITSQDALRGIVTDNSNPDMPIKGAVIKTSWSDFIKSMNHFGIASGVQGNDMIIERFQDSFDSTTTIVDIGQVTDARLSIAEDIIFNTIKTGGKTVEYSNNNGRFEFNQEQQWSTPVTKIVKEGDLTTPFRRDPYGAEFARINLEGKTTTDDKSDNDTWMININPEVQHDDTLDIDYYELNYPVFAAIEGIPDPENTWNLLYTPKWTLYNNAAFLHSVFDRLDTEYIKFTTAAKNSQLKTVGSIVMDEDDNIQIGSMAAKIFEPYYFTFTTEVPVNLLELLDANPYGKIKFHWNEQDWYGYVVDVSIKPAVNDKSTWKLLALPNQNLLNFNR